MSKKAIFLPSATGKSNMYWDRARLVRLAAADLQRWQAQMGPEALLEGEIALPESFNIYQPRTLEEALCAFATSWGDLTHRGGVFRVRSTAQRQSAILRRLLSPVALMPAFISAPAWELLVSRCAASLRATGLTISEIDWRLPHETVVAVAYPPAGDDSAVALVSRRGCKTYATYNGHTYPLPRAAAMLAQAMTARAGAHQEDLC
jgi:hypothetical protein